MTDKENKQTDEVNDKELEDISGGALSLGKPKDKFEKEADKVSDEVMKGKSAEGLVEPTP